MVIVTKEKMIKSLEDKRMELIKQIKELEKDIKLIGKSKFKEFVMEV